MEGSFLVRAKGNQLSIVPRGWRGLIIGGSVAAIIYFAVMTELQEDFELLFFAATVGMGIMAAGFLWFLDAQRDRARSRTPAANRVRVVGVHPVPAVEPIHLIELEVEDTGTGFYFGAVTQEWLGQPPDNWQVAFGERETGRELGRVRFALFFHYLDPALPLLTPFGPVAIPPESPMPEHLRDIRYERP